MQKFWFSWLYFLVYERIFSQSILTSLCSCWHSRYHRPPLNSSLHFVMYSCQEQQPPHRRDDGRRHGRAARHQALLVPDHHRHPNPAGPPAPGGQHLSGDGVAAATTGSSSGMRPQPGRLGAVGWHRLPDQRRWRGTRGHLGSPSLPDTTV
jgi:hypothetical protein